MKTNFCVIAFLFAVSVISLLFGSGLVSAEDQLKARHVTLSLEEFEDLFSSAKLKEAERKFEDDLRHYKQEHDRKIEQLEGERLRQRKQEESDQLFRQKESKLPQNFEVLEFLAAGTYNASTAGSSESDNNMAVFEVSMIVRIMADPFLWTTVPLVGNTTVASHFQIELWQGGNFIDVDPLVRKDIMLLRRRNASPELVTNLTESLFRIKYRVYSRLSVQATSRNNKIHQLAWSQFLYPLSNFSLRVHNSALQDLNVQPVEAVWRVVQDVSAVYNETTKPSSDLFVTLPLTADKIEIRWLDKSGADDELYTGNHKAQTTHGSKMGQNDSTDNESPLVEDVGPQVTVLHDVMHLVSEGTVRSIHIMEFVSLSSSSELSSTPVVFALKGEKARVTSLEGYAVQSWDVVSSSREEQVVRVVWKGNYLDTSASILIHTESDRSSGVTHEQVELPRIECRSVLRQTGHVGVTKDSNVELHEHKVLGGISKCEPNEISSQLRLNIREPIVHSYKYLNPTGASVILDVKEHTAMETLEATVDRLHYRAVVTETHTMHNLLVILQSTKLQYLELISLPDTASMFTLHVNSVPAKPAMGEERNSILVPLLVGLDPEAANAGRSLHTSVELSYISSHGEALGGNGTLPLAPPRVKLPISVLTTHLRLPESYDYEFSGDFGKPSRDLAFPLPSAYSYQTGKRVIEKDYQFSFKDDVWPDDEEPKEASVKIVTPNTGLSYFFHRLMVVGTQLTLNATYAEKVVSPERSSWWSVLFG